MGNSLLDIIEMIAKNDEYAVRYDASMKEVLANKQILARILKYTLEEFSEIDIETIINNMDEPEISSIRMEPGLTNTGKVKKTSEEDNVLGEGKIYYDIRFSAYIGKQPIKILINIEAQKSTDKHKLGYQLDNRILYYLGRMISAQKEVEFVNSDYDNLKAVRSIWICMDTADDEDSINRIHFVQDTIYGKEMKLANLDKVQGVIIRLRKNSNLKESENKLIAMLEDLIMRDDSFSIKKKKLSEYGIVVDLETERRLNTMCNLSEALIERSLEQGLEQGREQGREIGLKQGQEIGLEQGKNVINSLNLLLINQNRFEDLKRAVSDKEYQSKLIKELLENDTENNSKQ
ncbi:hypothetical protein [Butyrivibrio sp. NC3005]|uniref:hypothetical protein n=1 Tax=Butyrivibrio sp. NC3005 TaxID=1280685 RepID=UPI000410B56F|nr:hypothetical protein [Butyrivibrio sp. NC3005]